MSENNGVIRIGRKGKVRFAFGADGEPFEVDVVAAWYEWRAIDEEYRYPEGDPKAGEVTDHGAYHSAMVDFATQLSGSTTDHDGTATAPITRTEALEFIRLLGEKFDELADFFRFRSREERGSPGSSGAGSSGTSKTELRFEVED